MNIIKNKRNYKILSLVLILFVCIININQIYSDYVITSIDIEEDYINNTGQAYSISGTLESETTDNVTLNIVSQADPDGLDFNVIKNGTNITATFYTTTDASHISNTWPWIQVDSEDQITVSGQEENDKVIYDSIAPHNGSINTILANTGVKYNNFYSKDFNINYTLGSDDESYIDNYNFYIVDVDDVENYSSNSEYSTTTDNNTSTQINIDPLAQNISDGNYYILIEARDIAGNKSNSEDVLSTKKQIYIDNTSPDYVIPDIGYFDENIIYVSENTFDLDLEVNDISDINSLNSFLKIFDPDDVQLSNSEYNNGYFSFSPEFTYQNNDVFKFYLDAYDNVDNLLEFDFNIFFDLNSPTTPTQADPFLEIDADKNVTITWQASSDGESGVKCYEVYRSKSSFDNVSNATKIHTTSDSSTLSFIDTDDKDQGERYYYGVLALDYAGNKSDAVIDSIHSGPEVDLEIEDDEEYTNLTSPKMYIEFSSDVNEIRFSCNNSSWSSWIEVDGDHETYSNFNITSGNGCNSDNEKKTIYVQARSEDDYPNKTSKSSDDIKYDSHAPEVPSNLQIEEKEDGSIDLTWNECDDNNSDVEYKVYFSLVEGDVDYDSNFVLVYDEYYNYSPNKDQLVYFKVSAIDEAGNESSLSSEVSGNTQRFGPTFDLSIIPSNKYNGIWYVGYGLKNIKIESDEELTSEPTIKLYIDSSYNNLPVRFDGSKTTTTDFNFLESGEGEIVVTGTNKELQNARDNFYFIVDSNIPVFDLNYTITDSNYLFYLENYSEDIYKVQYLLDNKDEICLRQIDQNTEVVDFNCLFDTTTVDDGNYTIHIIAYDYALNTKKEIFNILIDNVNEIEVEATNLKENVDTLLEDVINTLNKLDQLLITVDSNYLQEVNLLKEKKTLAEEKYNSSNYLKAKEIYNEINNSLLDIKSKLPKESIIKNKSSNIVYDVNYSVNLYDLTTDSNAITKTQSLYESSAISIDRNFLVQEINSKKYFSTILNINNNSNEEKTITIVEKIPKSFAENIKDLVFNKEVEVLVEDPIIKYTLTIPANSTETLRYNRLSNITDVDVVTIFNSITFSDPIVLSGEVNTSNINYDKPINYKLLIIIVSVMLILIIVMLVVGFVIKKKQAQEDQLGDIKTKQVMNQYLGKNSTNKKDIKEHMSLQNKDHKDDEDEDKENNKDKEGKKISKEEQDKKDQDKFKEDYAFIMNAIKKRE
jgi:hypothetical protein